MRSHRFVPNRSSPGTSNCPWPSREHPFGCRSRKPNGRARPYRGNDDSPIRNASTERAHCRPSRIAQTFLGEAPLAKQFDGAQTYDLICFFDCLHDMGDPVGAAAHVRESLKSDGTWMIVEPIA